VLFILLFFLSSPFYAPISVPKLRGSVSVILATVILMLLPRARVRVWKNLNVAGYLMVAH
jgi:hypothetical protein